MDNLSTSLTDARENRPSLVFTASMLTHLSTILTRELINVTLTSDISSRIADTIPLIRNRSILALVELYAFRMRIFRV